MDIEKFLRKEFKIEYDNATHVNWIKIIMVNENKKWGMVNLNLKDIASKIEKMYEKKNCPRCGSDSIMHIQNH